MLTFFRRIKNGLFGPVQVSEPASPAHPNGLSSGRAGKYLVYVMGEITLVVFGILIALQINNWNEKRKSELRELNLLNELKINLETNVKNLQVDVNMQEYGVLCLTKVVNHLEEKKPFNDSLSYYLEAGMPAPDAVLTSSAFETLKSTGLELISAGSLRRDIINLFEVKYPYLMQETKRLEDQVWPAVVVPMEQKYFKITFDKHIPTDYPALLNDQEYINMLSFRITLRINSTILKKNNIQYTAEVIASIDQELKNRKFKTF